MVRFPDRVIGTVGWLCSVIVTSFFEDSLFSYLASYHIRIAWYICICVPSLLEPYSILTIA